ncbi:srg-58, partial [Pristionchus pacificus]|uniref:Serpentine receptor class gamma n=1 Tax=Pristionchus pacificus TaxID=54126 RepID=A0A2A6B823_PRIPA
THKSLSLKIKHWKSSLDSSQSLILSGSTLSECKPPQIPSFFLNFTHTMNTRNVIQLGYGIPGILTYFLVFYAMIGIRKVLSRSFVWVYVIMALTNIITWLNAWSFLRLTDEPFFFFYFEWLKTVPFIIEVQTFLVSQFYYGQNIDALLVTFDRFAAVYGMLKNMKWWEDHYVAISIIAHLIGLGVQAAIRLPMETLLLFDPKNQVYGVAYGPNDMHTLFAIQDLGKLVPNENLGLVFEIMYVTSDIFSLGPGIYTLLLPGPIRKFLVRKITNCWKTVVDPNKTMITRNIVQLAYGIPGILTYFLVFYAMIGIRKTLSPSFIFVYVVMALTNIVTWLNAWSFLRLTAEPFFFFYYEWLQTVPFVIEIQIFLVTQFYYAQNIDALLVTFDRFTAVYGMLKNMKWWEDHYIIISIVAHLIGIGIQAAIRLPMETILFFNANTKAYGTMYGPNDKHNEALSSPFQVAFGLIVTTTCLILNIYSYKSLRHLRSTKSASIKSPFLFIATCIWLTQMFNLLVTTLFAINAIGKLIPREHIGAVYEIMFVTSDIFSLGPGVYTLLLPGPIRRFLVRKLTSCWKTMFLRNTIQLMYGVPLICGYFLVLYAMYSIRKKLSGSIILVYVMLSITNITTWLNVWMFLKFINEPFFFFYYEWIKYLPILIQIHTFLVSHFYYAQNIDVLLLTFDRFAAIYALIKDFRWWNRHYLSISVLVHVVAIGVQLALRLPMDISLKFNAQIMAYILEYGPAASKNEKMATLFQIAFGIFIGATCLALNGLSYKSLQHLRSTKTKNLKSPFLIIASCILITQILNFTTVIATRILGAAITAMDITLIYEFMYVTSDIFSIGPALYTILLPGPIRTFLIKKLVRFWQSMSIRTKIHPVIQPVSIIYPITGLLASALCSLAEPPDFFTPDFLPTSLSSIAFSTLLSKFQKFKMWSRNAIQLFYGIPGIALYLLAFNCLYSIRKSINRSFLNIATWLNAWMFLKLVNEPQFFFYYEWISKIPVILNIHSFLVSHFYYVQNINLLLLTYDRFNAILHMGEAATRWKRSFLYVAIIVHTLAFGTNLAIRIPMVTVMTFDTANARYVAMQSDSDNAEKYFFVFSVFIFISQFLNLIIAALVVILQQWKDLFGIDLHTVFEFTYFTSDLLSLGPALYLIFLPGPVRKHIGEKIGMALFKLYLALDSCDQPPEIEVYRNPQAAINQNGFGGQFFSPFLWIILIVFDNNVQPLCLYVFDQYLAHSSLTKTAIGQKTLKCTPTW